MFYKNALQAVWLDYTTQYIVKQDSHIIENFYENQRIMEEGPEGDGKSYGVLTEKKSGMERKSSNLNTQYQS
jgi:hypothetical protein